MTDATSRLADPPPPGQPPSPASARLTSLDAFRGVTMAFMASEIMHIPSVARHFPESGVARVLADLLDRAGDTMGATRWFREVVHHDADFADARERLRALGR